MAKLLRIMDDLVGDANNLRSLVQYRSGLVKCGGSYVFFGDMEENRKALVAGGARASSTASLRSTLQKTKEDYGGQGPLLGTLSPSSSCNRTPPQPVCNHLAGPGDMTLSRVTHTGCGECVVASPRSDPGLQASPVAIAEQAADFVQTLQQQTVASLQASADAENTTGVENLDEPAPSRSSSEPAGIDKLPPRLALHK